METIHDVIADTDAATSQVIARGQTADGEMVALIVSELDSRGEWLTDDGITVDPIEVTVIK